ncbi:MAG: hypothetical protein KBD32_06070 [Burkholderiales bacterium]|nr:hypothetical protein [Burkholderiales bacterium]
MSISLKQIPFRQLLVKVIAYVALFYLLLVIVSIAVTGYIFINLDAYKQRIEQAVLKYTTYELVLGSIQTKLNNSYLPEIIIKNTSLINPIHRQQELHIDNLDFVLSYSSIWHLKPIFNKISLDGANLKLEQDIKGNLILNGITVYDPLDQTLENTKNSRFDIEKWLLLQHEVVLNHVNLSVLDLKNGLPEMNLRSIRIGLERNLWSKRRLYIDVYGKTDLNFLEAELKWQGGKFEDWKHWDNASLKVRTLSDKNTFVSKLQNYLPNVVAEQGFDGTTALEASMHKGRLQKLAANFDINNFKVAMSDANLVNFPKLGGTLNIDLIDQKYYTIQAKNLVAVTSAGALFDNAEAEGKYVINQNGNVHLSNTNLVALNNLLSLFDATKGLNIDGIIKQIKYSWKGGFIAPKSYELIADFNDISIKSTRSDYPSLSHVSGTLDLSNDAGKLNLSLKNSVLNYDQIFLIPYEFKSLQSQIDWNLSDKKILTVNIHRTNLETKDFKGWLDGVYTNDPSKPISPSYLTMHAHLERALISKIGDYLPKAIPMSVHKWLNMGLAGGHAANANMLLKGPLSNFPFRDGNGLFYITADLDNAKVQYVKDWPPIEQIRGQFILKNTNITIKPTSGILQRNQLDSTVVVIPDFSDPNGVYLTADGNAHGSTANFMDYLKHTPINDVIGKLPEKLITEGNGSVKIHLKVPFKDPKHTEVKGIYHFDNNQVKFDLPIPELSAVNGDLGFTQRGVEIKSLVATAFNSQAKLTAGVDANDKMWFKIFAPDLDYQAVTKFYLPLFESIVSGKANTLIDFQIGKHGIENLNANSQLQGVSFDAPTPLKKLASESQPMSLNLQPAPNNSGVVIRWSYADLLKGQQFISSKSAATNGQIAIGRGVSYLDKPDPNSVMSINVNLPLVNIEEWIAMVTKVTKTVKLIKTAENSTSLSQHSSGSDNLASQSHYQRNVFPLQIYMQTANLELGKMSLGAGVVNMVVDSKQTYFNLYSPIANGAGDFNYAESKVQLRLDKFMLYKKIKTPSSESATKINFVNGSESVNHIQLPDISVSINNFYYQNHNLGSVSTMLHQEGVDLYMESGVMSNQDAEISFNGTNYCFGCGRNMSYVDFSATAKVKNLGNSVYNLDFGRIISDGHGTLETELQWNGAFQDFNLLQTVGTIKAKMTSGKLLKVDPGVFGGLLSIINLQGLFEFGSGDINSIFKKGFYFNRLDLNVDILTSQVLLKQVYMSGPLASVKSAGKVNFANNTLDAEVAITPKIGFAVALTAGFATLNPVVGLAVYVGELLSGDAQNDLFTVGYHVTGDLKKPSVKRVDLSDQLFKNMNSTIGN